MGQPLRISVLVASHNYERFILEAVESALAQSYPPYEVIVIDDGSTDRSPALLRERYAGNSRVRLELTDNVGQLGAFCRAFRLADGDVITFLDADDFWRADHLKSLARIYAARADVDFVYTNLELAEGASGRWHRRRVDEDVGTGVLEAYFLQPWIGSPTSGMSLRRPLCAQVLDVPEALWSDWKTRADDCLVYGAALLGAHRYYVAEATAVYRVHGGNSWYGSNDSAPRLLRHEWRLRRAIEHYGRRVGLPVLPPMSVILEFKSKADPTFWSFLFYVRLLGRVPWPVSMHLRQVAAMFVYYLTRKAANLISRRGRESRLEP